MIARTRPAELASYTSPGMDAGLLQIIANQIAYQFVFDDRAEEVGRKSPGLLLPMLEESVAVLRDDAFPSTTLGAALADLYRQVRERCTPAQAARWAAKSREYVHGLLYEAVAQAHTPPIPTRLCTSIRALTAGVLPRRMASSTASNGLPPVTVQHSSQNPSSASSPTSPRTTRPRRPSGPRGSGPRRPPAICWRCPARDGPRRWPVCARRPASTCARAPRRPPGGC
ncbi:hypothetical protein N4P33_12570 [Streptomyces sp. 15-116A]|uniref:hypothetical protein n=1 Tax=Streptomyces sp. 15-116A TaxID=2259035 RepID=UPI0021B1BE12|nr:hypothetical protein [Streptomyces sp. 15-116A]MCT7353000.1 hypothetical protein [Streptomyces sp. 15-116A]